MTLNKRTGRMFMSVGWTWNPLAGCTHGCPYCYARRLRAKFKQGFDPVFRENFLKDELPDDGTWIFVGSMGDTFCEGFSNDEIRQLLNTIEDYNGSCKFLLQTKNPIRFFGFLGQLRRIKDKIILGTTIETNRETLGTAPQTTKRSWDMENLRQIGFKTFISMEPMADFDIGVIKEWIFQIQPEAIELGLENYTSFLTPPPEKKIVELVNWIRETGFQYVLKENLKHLEGSMIDSE